MITPLLLALAVASPSVDVDIAQSGKGERRILKVNPTHEFSTSMQTVKLKRRPFTLRFQLKDTDNVRVFATFHEEDTRRKDLFCGGCGMADYEGNKDWGVLVNSEADRAAGYPPGYNYWYATDAKSHRCDPEPTPGNGRCWRTIWRVGDVRLEDLPQKELFLVIAVGTTDPKTYETVVAEKRTVKLVFEGGPRKKKPAPKKKN
jgi:hypothetical protein